tara:strand:- start:86 stop:529 length:444 start_codon:yes stop_codon:yes gene_type:complete
MAEILTQVAGMPGQGEFLESLFSDGVTWKPESQTVATANTQYFTENNQFGYEKEGFGKGVYSRMMHYKISVAGSTYGSDAQKHANKELRREYTFMVKNWEKGIAGRLPKSRQGRFNEIHEDMLDMKDKGYFDKYHQKNNPMGYRLDD